MDLRKADLGIPAAAQTISYVCRSLLAVLQQASQFVDTWHYQTKTTPSFASSMRSFSHAENTIVAELPGWVDTTLLLGNTY